MRNRPFLIFWVGQTLSQLGSSFTAFALPLLVFHTTGSGLDLGIAAAAAMLPYPLFGLLLGAWTDRHDRKRLMIRADLGRAALIASIPLLALWGVLPIWWIYVMAFATTTLTIVFEAAEFAAVPSLAAGADLNALNGRVQATYQAAAVAGPFLAGALLAVVSVPILLLIDAGSFMISAACLRAIATPFNRERPDRPASSIVADAVAGLRYVLGHPVLRTISIMMALVNLLAAASNAQLVLFLKRSLGASDREVGWVYSAASLGMVASALLAGPLRRRLSFSAVALAALAFDGAMTAGLALVGHFSLALVLWAGCSGMGMLFNVVAGSLRQAIVPDQLLGRVMTVAGVLAWSAIPIGSLAGGLFVDATGDVSSLFLAVGAAMIVVPLAFAFTPVGRAARYEPAAASTAST